ncbi:MAG: hypothetical protein SGCHY_003964 [Lobulomycetales sp.]
MAEDTAAEDENGITMADYLHEQKHLEIEAARAFPGKFTRCTWPDTSNQKLYTCTTCYPSDETHAPVVFCEACAVKCHPPHHELVDLYSKRNYKCDCGTSACALLSPCSFLKSKQDITNDNVYSANLLNRYCFCEKPYLADKARKDNMFQCIFCQDWFHDLCLDSFPGEDAFRDLVCHRCVAGDAFFLHRFYACNPLFMFVSAPREGAGVLVPVVPDSREGAESASRERPESASIVRAAELDTGSSKEAEKESQSTELVEERRQQVVERTVKDDGLASSAKREPECRKESLEPEQDGDSHAAKRQKLLENAKTGENFNLVHVNCPLAAFHAKGRGAEAGPRELPRANLFLLPAWRREICTCDDCKRFYAAEEITFLMDEFANNAESNDEQDDDDDEANEVASLEEAGMAAYSTMPRETAVEAMRAYVDMRENLYRFLGECADRGKTVSEEDIQAFFASLDADRSTENNQP